MEQYIRKSAIVAEIRKYLKNSEAFLKYHHNRNDKSVYAFEQEKLVMCDLLYFIDTLDVKEVDLEKEYKNFIKSDNGRSMFETAKHFYELGLKAQKGE